MDAKIKALWAKKSPDGEWLPLVTHMSDTAESAKILWDTWIANTVKERIAEDLAEGVSARNLFVFLAGVHDVGKASPAFQCRESWYRPNIDEEIAANLKTVGYSDVVLHNKSLRHEFISHCVLLRQKVDTSVAVVVGGHHGKPPTKGDLKAVAMEQKALAGFTKSEWAESQELLFKAALKKAGITQECVRTIKLTKASQILLSGLIIMTDWLASNTDYFPLIPSNSFRTEDSQVRAEKAFVHYDLPCIWRAFSDAVRLYGERFKGLNVLYPVQEAIVSVASENPDLMIIEAPMGEGKTESALVAAEVVASFRGCRGIYFALPTQATTNAMFSRILEWLSTFETADNPYSVMLLHGKSLSNKEFAKLKLDGVSIYDESERDSHAQVHEWFSGRKKEILADFTVGTVDQVLMAGLKRKHLALRHLGLAGKVVIIDECHAYDTYMQSYLQKALSYLGAYKVPTIVLSATLPEKTRQKLVNAYLGIEPDSLTKKYVSTPTISYPQITYTTGNKLSIHKVNAGSKTKDVVLKFISTENIVTTLSAELSGGGYAGVIVNTVRKSQELYTLLVKQFPNADVTLLHSGFILTDRAEKEEELVNLLGKKNINRNGTRIVVGTQIFEQSMDIDFDVLVTDLCPIDLLIQRIGRLHRHDRPERPAKLKQPTCYVLDTDWGKFDRGSQAVYGPYLLAKTKANLPDILTIPKDIPILVELVYGDAEPNIPAEYKNWYTDACSRYEAENKVREGQSKTFQVDKVTNKGAIVGWLEGSSVASESLMEASVRGVASSLEVIPVVRRKGRFYLLSGAQDEEIPFSKLCDDDARKLAYCTLRLPYVFSIGAYMYAKKLEEQKEVYGLGATWGANYLLRHTNFLILDEDLSADLGDYKLTYSKDLGITYIKK